MMKKKAHNMFDLSKRICGVNVVVHSPFRYAAHTVGALEVPDEIALIYTVSGCPLRCAGCHSADLRNPEFGKVLDSERFLAELKRYSGLASCVCFLGGEWQEEELIKRLREAHEAGYTTCLYSGRESVEDRIAVHLDYLKLGPYIAGRGGLDSATTNQRFLDLRTGRDLTHRFQSPLGEREPLLDAA
jgi:anaerobic ribonucleoside-triphosphate reductase activating protein